MEPGELEYCTIERCFYGCLRTKGTLQNAPKLLMLNKRTVEGILGWPYPGTLDVDAARSLPVLQGKVSELRYGCQARAGLQAR